MNERASPALPFAALALVSSLSLSCAPFEDTAEHASDDSTLQRRTAAIVGGTASSGDPEVFMLTMQYSNGVQSTCSATLINRRTLLTAAHCVDPRMANAQGVDITATNKTYALTVSGNDSFHVLSSTWHPSWSPASRTLDYDVALLLLDEAPLNVTPKPWNTASVYGLNGKPLRAVGYGTTGPNAPNSAGVKRTVSLAFKVIDQHRIYLGDGQGRGICHGDSGGPSFHTFPDGVERLVGVHSYTATEACVDGADTRVDAFAGFIYSWMAVNEAPACSKDSVCREDCETVDPDCVCQADGVCNSQCPNPFDDPDCPRNCATDGICEAVGCAVPDADCVPDGEACMSANVCTGRRCVTDAQREYLYCSRSCAVSEECPSTMQCAAGACRLIQLPNIAPNGVCVPGASYCVGRLLCAGAEGAPTRCVAACNEDSDCPRDTPCVDSAAGRFCNLPVDPPILLERATAEAPLAQGCGSAPGGLSALSCLFAARALRRRRDFKTPSSTAQAPRSR